MIIMTDISFTVPARLMASRDLHAAHGDTPLDKGSLGRMVSKVMDTEPSECWRYSIFTDAGSYLHAHEIEALASTRRYADWNAGHA
jgi:hypothetical protein